MRNYTINSKPDINVINPNSNNIRYNRQNTNYTNNRIQRPSNIRKYNPYGDSFEKTHLSKNDRMKIAKRKNALNAYLNRALGILIGAGLILGANKINDELSQPETNFNANNHTVEEVSEWSDVDLRAILIANGIDSSNEHVDEIILPEKYNSLDEEISYLEDKLNNDTITFEEAQTLDELKGRREEQNSLAQVYIFDNDKVIILPNEYNTSAEDIKDAFEISDGVIRKYNDISYTWETDEEGSGYRDFTSSHIPYSGIIIPLDELN